MQTRGIHAKLIVSAITVAAMMWAPRAHAGVDPVNLCVSTKMKSAGKYCQSVLKAWSTWDKNQDVAKRDAALSKAAGKLEDQWSKAETKATSKGGDCALPTVSADELKLIVGTAVTEIVGEINTGLDLGNKDDATCGSKFLKAAAKKCSDFLKAESKHIKKPEKDPDRATLEADKAKASQKFTDSATPLTCATGTSVTLVEESIDGLTSDVVYSTTVSPSVDNTQFMTISPTGTITYQGKDLTPTCMNSSPYSFFAKRGSENKLVMYYQGGGACWEQLTCLIPVCDNSVNPGGSDNPNTWTSGFADLTNPDNPFKDWNIVLVSYCSCDIHFGDAAQDYNNNNPATPLHVEHRGFHNAKVVEKWARERFLDPEVVFVTGSSAGAYGAIFHAPLLEDVWKSSEFRVLGDAGNGVITPSFLQNEFNNWNFKANLPTTIPGVVEAIDNGTGVPAYMQAVAKYFPETNWANYSAAFDGGSGGQTGFYNVMLNGNNPVFGAFWWQASCAFNQKMHQQAVDTEAAVAANDNNYRYYIGTGSRHTMWGHNKVYSDTTGGVPTIVDWVNEMLTSGPGWVNVEASPFNVLLSGDPKPPTIPTPPFVMSGSDIVVNCP